MPIGIATNRTRRISRPRWPFTLNAQSVQAQGLRAWWPGEVSGGKSLIDASGRGFYGTLSGPTWAARNGGARVMSFDGSNDYVTRAAAVIPGYPFSMGCWFNSNSGGEQAIMEVGQDAGSQQFLIYLRDSNDRPTFFFRDTVAELVDTGQSHTGGVWQFVLVSCLNSANKTFYYYDGTTLHSAANATDIVPTNLDLTTLGRQRDSSADFAPFSGYLDWAMFWNYALPVSVVASLVEPKTMYNLAWQPGRMTYSFAAASPAGDAVPQAWAQYRRRYTG